MPRILILLIAISVAACERTTFEQIPLEAGRCDPELIGAWSSLDEDPKDNGQLLLNVSADCELGVIAHTKDIPETGATTKLQTARSGEHAVVWFDASWAHERFALNHSNIPKERYVYRYDLSAATLTLYAPAHRAVAHRVIDRDLPGRVEKHGDDLHIRLGADLSPSALAEPRFFGEDALRFQRQSEPKP